MTLVTLFFFAHQPIRLKPYETRLDTGARSPEELFDFYFDETLNRDIFHRVAQKCYYPATRALLDLVERYHGEPKPFRLAFGLSGTFLDSAARYDPGVLALFQELAQSRCVEFTAETYYHSLSSLFDAHRSEFNAQVQLHSQTIERLFGRKPTVFRNTECIYNNSIAAAAKYLGFEGIITEGVDWVLDGRSPDFVYAAPCGLPVLLRNYQLSDDVAYRFPNRNWEGWPLNAETFAGWLANNTDMNVTLAMDYEALGEHIWADTGIFDFLRALPDAVRVHPQLEFVTPTDAVRRLPVHDTVVVDDYATISWADKERDTSAWLGNEPQRLAYEEIKRLDGPITAAGDADLQRYWRYMQTSDHLYYLSDKGMNDGDVHQYFSAYGSPFSAFVRLQTALYDLRRRTSELARAKGK
ncbi:MAG: glycoside hydrolase family 57 protein [Armatimonadetes bacterium]|nr:glycoside hydrolase family 57 protein [Armatimonadota bacterium]MDE2207546.1 glycoside hydrolase family 57 protein [Armatimonadota bacterium]